MPNSRREQSPVRASSGAASISEFVAGFQARQFTQQAAAFSPAILMILSRQLRRRL